jgi:hypothetical protein
MKYFGKKIQGPNEEIVAIPRPDGDVIFKAQAIMSYERFNQLVPEPKPPKIRKKGGVMLDDFDDANYKLSIQQYGQKKYYFIVVESLKATPGLEWETIDPMNPDTWKNIEKELEESGFNNREIRLIIDGVLRANTIDQTKVDEALQRFLLLQQEQQQTESSQKEEQKAMQSGEPVNGSESNPQISTQTVGTT